MLLVPHLERTSMMVAILLSFSKQYLLMLVWGKTGGIVVKSKSNFWDGDKQDIFFYAKDTSRQAKLELLIIYKRRSFQSIYIGIHTNH